jgi:hypothetical protein
MNAEHLEQEIRQKEMELQELKSRRNAAPHEEAEGIIRVSVDNLKSEIWNLQKVLFFIEQRKSSFERYIQDDIRAYDNMLGKIRNIVDSKNIRLSKLMGLLPVMEDKDILSNIDLTNTTVEEVSK